MRNLRPNWESLPVLAVAGTLATIAVQGFAYGVSNNVFHIPLVLHDDALPQFAGDPFVQSLRRYVSPVFPALSLVATRATLPALFLLLHALGRFLTLWAMLRLLALCGVAGIRLPFAGALLVAMPELYGITELGRQELFPPYFTHTALAQAALLWGVVRLAQGRFVAACVLSAVAFDVNAFVGAWMAGPLLAALAIPGGRPPWRTAAAGVAAAAAVALPVAAWIVRVAATDGAVFDYPAFLRAYYPFHFFIGAASLPSVLHLAAAVAAGALAFRMLGFRAGLVAGGGFAAVFVAGMAVGAVAASPLLLNLHLLRVDGPLVLLAACGTVAVVVQSATRTVFQAAAALVVAAGCLGGTWPLALLGLLVLHLPATVQDRAGTSFRPAWVWVTRRPGPAIAAAALLLATDAAALGAFKHRPPRPGAAADSFYEGHSPAIPFWRDAKLWARDATPPGAVFLVPLRLEGFEADALRQAWVDWKSGAAAMWAPSFHREWAERVAAVSALRTPADRIRYACAHGLDYAVLDLRGEGRGEGHGTGDAPDIVAGLAPAFRNPDFAIYPTRSCPPGP